MAYRLYVADTTHGIAHINDKRYHILHTQQVDGTTAAIVYNEQCGDFTVAYGLEYELFNSIHWAQGYCYDNIMDAVNEFIY